MKYHIFAKSLLLSLLSLICLTAVNAQDTAPSLKLKGVVRDRATNSHLIGANVAILNASDSVLASSSAQNYTWNNTKRALEESAEFNITIPKEKDVFTIRFAYEGYDTVAVPLDLTNLGRREFDRDLGTYYMNRTRVNTLDEVTVTASKVKFYNKGDTIVYNADAFQLAEGSMLDELIKQLPGVEIRDGGQIYVNGKYVESLLLNGKDFFKGDNQVMLDNLAAYTVDKVEVYDKQSEESKFLGRESKEGEQYVMDVKIKKEYIGGWTINAEGGAGTEERYLARLFAMHFTGSSQITLFGNMNNLNDSRRPTQDDSWDPESQPRGTMRYKEGGMDYTTENNEGTRKAQGSLSVTSTRRIYDSRSTSINFLPSFDTYGNGSDHSVSKDLNIKTNHELSYQTKMTRWVLSPEFSYSHNSSESEGISATFDSEHTPEQTKTLIERLLSGTMSDTDRKGLVNASFSNGASAGENLSAGLRLASTIKIPKVSDYISLYAGIRHDNSRSRSNSLNLIGYGDLSLMPSARNQHTNNRPQHNTTYSAGASYNLVLSDKLRLALGYDANYNRDSRNSSFYLGELLSDNIHDYTLDNIRTLTRNFDPGNSYTSVQTSMEQSVRAHAELRPSKKFSFNVDVPLTFVDRKLDYEQDAQTYSARYNSSTFLRPISSSISYRTRNDSTGRSIDVSLNYSMSSRIPSLRDMITVPDTRNPLSTYLGNPDLKCSTIQNLYLYLGSSFKRLYLSGGASYNLVNDDFARGYTYETATGRRIFKTYNVDGTKSANAYVVLQGYWAKFDFFTYFNYSYSKRFDMIGENTLEPVKTSMRSSGYYSRVELSWRICPKAEIKLSAAPNFTIAKSERESYNNLNTSENEYSLSGKFTLPFNWGVSTRMTLFNRSGYDDPDMNRSDWIWNARLWKTLCKGKLMLGVTAYDLLHQMRSTYLSVSPTGKWEETTNTIPRYILFHLQYRINIQPKKQIATRTHYY